MSLLTINSCLALSKGFSSCFIYHNNLFINIYNNQFLIRPEDKQPTHMLGTSLVHRRWASLSLNQEVSVAPYVFENQYQYLGKIELEVGFFQRNQDIKDHFDTDEMSRIFCEVC